MKECTRFVMPFLFFSCVNMKNVSTYRRYGNIVETFQLCSERPSLSKGGTHRATGPVITVVFKKVGSTAFSATGRGRRPQVHVGWGWGSCVATALRSRKRVRERRKTGGMKKGMGPKRGDRHGEPTKR